LLGSRLLTKILVDFLFGVYLLNSVLNHATNHTHQRYRQVQKTQNTDQFATKIKMKANTQAAHLQIAQADTRPKFAKELFFPTNRQQCN